MCPAAESELKFHVSMSIVCVRPILCRWQLRGIGGRGGWLPYRWRLISALSNDVWLSGLKYGLFPQRVSREFRVFPLDFDWRKLFSETCDERALPLVGSRSESVWKGGSRGGVAGGWNAACQSLVKWYIPGQIVQTAAPQALTEN